jgi:hypothetical protein
MQNQFVEHLDKLKASIEDYSSKATALNGQNNLPTNQASNDVAKSRDVLERAKNGMSAL